MKLFHILNSLITVSTRHRCVLSRSISLLQMRVIISIFNLCSTHCKEYSVSEINLTGCINLISITYALTLLMTSMEFMFRFLLLSTSYIVVWVDDSFYKYPMGSIPNCVSRLLDDFHSSFLVTLTYSWVFLISLIITIHESKSQISLILFLYEYIWRVS